MKILLISIILLFSNNSHLNSQESFSFNFENTNSNQVSFVKLYNGFIYIYGYANLVDTNNWDNYLIKYDLEGNQIFNKVFYHEYRDVAVNMEIFNDKIYILSDWDSLFTTLDESVLSIFDLEGNLLNSTAFGSKEDDMIADMLIDGDDIYLSGSDQKTNYLMKLNNTTLTKEYIKKTTGLSPYRSEGLLKYNNKLYTCGYNVYQQSEFLVQKFDLNSDNEITKKINIGSRVILIDGYFIENNYFIFGRNYISESDKMFVFKLDTNLNILEQREFSNAFFNNRVIQQKDKFYFTYKTKVKTYLVEMDKDLNIISENEIDNVSYLIDIQEDYFIYFDNRSPKSKLIFDKNKCIVYKDTRLLEINDIDYEEINSKNVMVEGPDLKKLNYLIKDSYLIMDKTYCDISCGNGSEFSSKLSTIDMFSFNNMDLTLEDSYLMTKEKEFYSYGSINHIEPVYISGGFTTEFSFVLDNGINVIDDGSLPGGDGLSFLFHTENTLLNYDNNQVGSGMGYHNRKDAVALEIDLYNNEEYNDPDGNHIAFQVPKDGVLEANHNDENTLAINSNIPQMISNGEDIYYCKIDYNDNILKVWLEKSQHYNKPVLEVNNFHFDKYLILLENSKAYVTITAVTGNSSQKQEIIFWDWCSFFVPESEKKNDEINEDDGIKEISIYPNPSSDYIFIEGNDSKDNIDFRDMTGRIIKLKNYNNRIDISQLNRGIYILKLNNQNYKIIKE